jgi:hypothetical protein
LRPHDVGLKQLQYIGMFELAVHYSTNVSKKYSCLQLYYRHFSCIGNLSPAMGARNQVGIGLSYRTSSLCSLATHFQTRFLESIPRPIAGLEFSALLATRIEKSAAVVGLFQMTENIGENLGQQMTLIDKI